MFALSHAGNEAAHALPSRHHFAVVSEQYGSSSSIIETKLQSNMNKSVSNSDQVGIIVLFHFVRIRL
jgi:hypothetical protein